MSTRRRPAIRIVAAGLAAALAFPSAAAACTVEEYMTAEDIASGRYDITPPDTYGGGPAGPHTHGDVAAPPADPAAAQPGSTPAATAAPAPPPAAVAPKPVTKPSTATGKEQTETQGATSPSKREAPTGEGDSAKPDPSPAAAKPRRATPAPPPRSTVPPPSTAAPAPVTQAPVAAVPPASPPAIEPVAQPTSRPAAERARPGTAARSAAADKRRPRRDRAASSERPAAVALPTQVAQRRTGSTVTPPAEAVSRPRAGVVTSADDGGQDPATVVVVAIGLLGAALLLLSRGRRSRVTAAMPSARFDDDVEAELQELIADEGRRKAAAERTDQRSAI